MNDGIHFKEGIASFGKLLDNVDIEKVSLEIYCRKYLAHLLKHRKYYLAIYADVLEKLVSHADKKKNQISLVDVGAGNGLLGIFAKSCGFKKVFINDIDNKFVAASRNLAQQLNIHMDGFIIGSIDEVKTFFKDEWPNAIVGTDVIEHIYNLEDFFTTMREINSSIVSVFTTASNPKNYFKARQLKKLQLKDEFEGGSPGDFVLFGDRALEPFYKIRQDIILQQLKNSDEETIDKLSKTTRGMNEEDILKAVNAYIQNGKMPPIPVHPTNTCNPLNSSWTERILSLKEYYTLYNSHGMRLKIYDGFYDEYKPGLKKLLNKLLNLAVRSLGTHFAPYIIFVGTKK